MTHPYHIIFSICGYQWEGERVKHLERKNKMEQVLTQLTTTPAIGTTLYMVAMFKVLSSLISYENANSIEIHAIDYFIIDWRGWDATIASKLYTFINVTFIKL